MGIPVKTILDVGVLSATPDLISAFGACKHLLFEPIVEWNSTIEQNYHHVPHEILNVAVTDHVGVVKLATASIMSGMEISHAYIVKDPKDGMGQREVPATTIDAVLEDRSEEGPFLLKIDVDGVELDVLRGAKKTLERCSVVVIEATLRTAPDRMAAVRAEGFQLFELVDLCYYDRTLYQVDLVFVNPQFLGSVCMPDIAKFDQSKWVNYQH